MTTSLPGDWLAQVANLASKPKDEQTTPLGLYDEAARRWGPFEVDCAATVGNALCPRFFAKEDNALLQRLTGERAWCNPPYSRGHLPAFLRWARYQVTSSASPAVCCLIPADTSTQWWHRFVLPDDARVGGVRLDIDSWGVHLRVPYRHHVTEVLLLSGRWPFSGSKDDPKFGSAFVTYLSPVGRSSRTGPRYAVTPEVAQAVSRAVEAGASVVEACERVGIDRRTWYRHLRRKGAEEG